MGMSRLAVITWLFFFIVANNVNAEGTVYPGGVENVFTSYEALQTNQCKKGTPNPECAVVSFFLCVDSFNFEHCERVGFPSDLYRQFLAQMELPHRSLEKHIFLRFDKPKFSENTNSSNLAKWLLPRAAMISAYIITPHSNGGLLTEEDYENLLNSGFDAGVPVEVFPYFFVFRWKDERWQLGKWYYGMPHGCEYDGSLTITDPRCDYYLWDNFGEDLTNVFPE